MYAAGSEDLGLFREILGTRAATGDEQAIVILFDLTQSGYRLDKQIRIFLR